MEDGQISSPKNYVNAWWTPTTASRVVGALKNSGAVAVKISWFVEQNLVQANTVNETTGVEEANLFSVSAESINEAHFEANTFRLRINGELYRFTIADNQFTRDTIASNLMGNRPGNAAASMLLDPALDDLKSLRQMLETHNTKVIGIRIVRSILIGLSISLGAIFLLITLAVFYVKSQN